jgi:prepilin-type N-terminal cleavage/methylation domain-containing protein
MDQRGMTLIELIAVLAIVGVLVCLSDGFAALLLHQMCLFRFGFTGAILKPREMCN